MKYLIFLIVCFLSCLSFAGDNTPILSDDFTITMSDIIYQENNLNYTIILKYSNNSWYLFSITPNNPTPTPTPTPNPSVDDYGSNTIAVLAEINKYRAEGAPCSTGGKSPLTYDLELSIASLNHSIDMAINNYFSHIGLDGSSPWDRVAKTKFSGQPLGENIAAGYSLNTVVKGWIDSPGHCINIMNSSANVMGFGWASKSDTDWGIYYTMITGKK
jgi:uncharacterized protein YkwD